VVVWKQILDIRNVLTVSDVV